MMPQEKGSVRSLGKALELLELELLLELLRLQILLLRLPDMLYHLR